MLSRPKNWLTGGIWKPKNPHSLEHLKFLYGVLNKNLTVTEQNKSLLVETLRSISEILIWGDQNDSSVFDFFLEKNMLAFFLKFMKQKSGRFICVQLLQTLNILFENISNETSVYYLLSNNHINSIIVHKFDFSDEEVMAYYISFLKTLSLKLNKHTIHFFYNENTNDFALYTEAIKFFNHSESMVRIAVRTITLNVYKVHDKSMLRYIRDKTAAPYFSNLVWFIGSHIIDVDSCVRNDADHNSRDRLADLVAEHLDHLHYLNDILCLNIDALNEVLTDHLLNRLFIPLYVYSLTKRRKFSALTDNRPHVNSVVSLFLLSQVFLIISHSPLVRQLAEIVFNGDINVCLSTDDDSDTSPNGHKTRTRAFFKPIESLAKTLDNNRGIKRKTRKRPNYRNEGEASGSPPSGESHEEGRQEGNSTFYSDEPSTSTENVSAVSEEEAVGESEPKDASESASESAAAAQNSTDEEKLLIGSGRSVEERQAGFTLNNRPYLEALFNALECSENDYEALFALCLLYALGHNDGINQELLDTVLMPTDKSQTKEHYNVLLVEKMIKIINLSCQTSSKVRLATLEMSVLLLKQLVYRDVQCFLQDRHLAAIEGAREESTLLLRNFYKVWEKSEEIFLDMFEDEFREMKSRPLNVEYLMMDANILLPPTGTPLTGIEFNKRLPCGEVERARRAIRVFFMLRDLSLTLRQELESQLPLTRNEECVKITDVLDLNNSDLIACTVITTGDNKKERRFLVIDLQQLILVEPDTRRLGWGVVKFVGFLQDVEVTGDKDDSRSLHITIHRPSMNAHARPTPLLSARFVFDDHIRCMAAKQRLTKGRLKARQRKMQQIARLLELPTNIVESMYQPPSSVQPAVSLRAMPGGVTVSGRSHPGRAKQDDRQRSSGSQAGRSRDYRDSGRSSSLPMPITRPRPTAGAARRITEQQQDETEIEEAEEATPSPEAHAIQSLNASRNADEHRSNKNGRSTPETSVMEIPLEDLGKTSKEKSTAGKVADFLTGRGGTKKPGGAVGRIQRSSSYSPRRGRTQSPGAESAAGKSVKVPAGERSRLEGRSGELRRPRAGSFPSPRRLASGISSVSDSSQNGKVTSTSFMIKPKKQASTDSEPSTSKKEVTDTKTKGHTRSRSNSSGTCPKTLTPAQEPTVSLITDLDSSEVLPIVGLVSPKLVAPAEPGRIRSLSEASSLDSEMSANQSASSASVGIPSVPVDKPTTSGGVIESENTDQKSSGTEAASVRPPFQSSQSKSGSPPDTSSASAIPERVERMKRTDSASEQLSRLAQMGQEQTVTTPADDSLEMSVCKSPDSDSANITDDDKETISPTE